MKSNTACLSGLSHPPTKVRLTRGYWLGKYEVTQLDFERVMGLTPWSGRDETPFGPCFPANYVTWFDCVKFCERMTETERRANRLGRGWKYTLPTEAQWENACRAGTTTNHYFGDTDEKMNDYEWWEVLLLQDVLQSLNLTHMKLE